MRSRSSLASAYDTAMMAGLGRRHVVERALARDVGLDLFLEHGERRDADQVPFAHLAEQLGAQDHVERLVPGHVLHLDRDLALHVVGGHDVHLPHVGQQAQDVVDVGAAEIEVDAPPDIALPGRRPARRQHQPATDDAAAAAGRRRGRTVGDHPGRGRPSAVRGPGRRGLGRGDRQHGRGGPDRRTVLPEHRRGEQRYRQRPRRVSAHLQRSSPHRIASSGSTRIALSTGCGSPLALVSIWPRPPRGPRKDARHPRTRLRDVIALFHGLSQPGRIAEHRARRRVAGDDRDQRQLFQAQLLEDGGDLLRSRGPLVDEQPQVRVERIAVDVVVLDEVLVLEHLLAQRRQPLRGDDHRVDLGRECWRGRLLLGGRGRRRSIGAHRGAHRQRQRPERARPIAASATLLRASRLGRLNFICSLPRPTPTRPLPGPPPAPP